jgi:tetratricopeptide (TPR) repeat protein
MTDKSVNAAILRAASKAKNGDIDGSIELYQEILQFFPHNKRALQGLATVNQPSVAGLPPPPQVSLARLITLYKDGKLIAAQKLAETLIQDFTESFIVWNILGATNMGLGNITKAIFAFKKATLLNPSYVDGFNNLGAAHQAQGNTQSAIEAYSKSLDLKPNYADAYYNMGISLQDQGKLKEATQAYKKAISLNPDYVDAYINLGNALRDQGKALEAILAYRHVITIKPNYPEVHYNLGLTLQSQGELKKASEAYKKAISLRPDYPQAFYNIGNILHEQGGFGDALEAYKKAILLKPNYAEAYNNMGLTLQSQGKLKEAAEAYDKAKSLNPNYAEAHYNIGVSLQDQGKLDSAIKAYKKAISLRPNFAAAYNSMGITLKKQGKLEPALQAYSRSLQFGPNSAHTYFNIGIIYRDLGKFDLAIEAYQKAILLKPDFPEAYYNMGGVLKDGGNAKTAVGIYNKAISLKPDYAEAMINLGNILQDQGKVSEAINCYNKVLLLQPDHAEACNNMGNALQKEGELEKALEFYKKAVSLKPNYAEAYNNIGVVLHAKGQPNEASVAFSDALYIRPNYAEAYHNLSMNLKFKMGDPHIKIVEGLLNDSKMDEDKCHLHYTLAKMYEDTGALENAFRSYVAGGALRKKLLNYNLKADANGFAAIKHYADNINRNALIAKSGIAEQTPVFIIGMPRSGTTLIEQIITCHSLVHGGGELTLLESLGSAIASGAKEANLKSLKHLRDSYLKSIAKISKKIPFVTDKMPQNFYFIGLICSAFPEAKIINVKRNPAATCWSNFKHYFAGKGLGYSYELPDVVSYYKLYDDLMYFWERMYGDRIYHCNYDQLTINQESETKNLISYLGLNWEDACLFPHKNERGVTTASQQQVREKVYTGSSEAWRKFEPHLCGLFDGLTN